jgi:hypothetical protein
LHVDQSVLKQVVYRVHDVWSLDGELIRDFVEILFQVPYPQGGGELNSAWATGALETEKFVEYLSYRI